MNPLQLSSLNCTNFAKHKAEDENVLMRETFRHENKVWMWTAALYRGTSETIQWLNGQQWQSWLTQTYFWRKRVGLVKGDSLIRGSLCSHKKWSDLSFPLYYLRKEIFLVYHMEWGNILFIMLTFFTIKFKFLAHFWLLQLCFLVNPDNVEGWISILQLQMNTIVGGRVFQFKKKKSAATFLLQEDLQIMQPVLNLFVKLIQMIKL